MASALQEGTFYVIINVGTKTALTFDSDTQEEGSPVQGFAVNLSDSIKPSQSWGAFRAPGLGESWQFQNSGSGAWLNLLNGDRANGTIVQASQKSDKDSQNWVLEQNLEPMKAVCSTLVNRASGTVIDLDAGNSSDG